MVDYSVEGSGNPDPDDPDIVIGGSRIHTWTYQATEEGRVIIKYGWVNHLAGPIKIKTYIIDIR